MGSRTQPPAAADRIYEDFEPFYEWNENERLVNVTLPGYRRDQLKVQVTSKSTLRIMGERLIFENRWRRFNIELPLLSDYDTDNVTAKFEGGTLSVTFGKLLKPKETTTPPPPTQDTPKAQEAKKTSAEVSDQKKEETKTEKTDKVSEEVKTNGSSETKEAAKAPPTTKNAKSVTRSKTRLIDFTLSLRANNDVIGDSDAGKNKWKKLLKWVMLFLSVVALVGLGFYYARNELTLSPGESEIESYFQEL